MFKKRGSGCFSEIPEKRRVFEVVGHKLQKLQAAGLDLDVEKSELIHFTTKCKPLSPNVTIGDSENATTIERSNSMRWLGIFFDSKLRFNTHVKKLAARAERITHS